MRTAGKAIGLAAIIGLGLLTGCGNPNEGPKQYTPPPPKPLPEVPPLKHTPIDKDLQNKARAEVDAAIQSSNEIIRAHALEALKDLKLPESPAIIVNALTDTSPLVRKAAALAAGEMQIHEAATQLNQNYETAQTQEMIAIIYALHRLGDTTHTRELQNTITDLRPQVRGDTVMVMGMLGERSAIPYLMQRLGKDDNATIRLESAEALWRLGDERGMDELIGATLSKYPDDQMVALLALAQPRDTRVLGHIEGQFWNDYPEVRLVAARAAGMLGSDRGLPFALQSAEAKDWRQRFLSAFALQAIARPDTQAALGAMMTDDNQDVRLAAAAALLVIGKQR